VLSVNTDGVTLRGLRLRGSGDSHDRVDAGILLQGNAHRVENNTLEDVLFGIHLKSANRALIKGNQVTGKAFDSGLRGDALRLWNSRFNRIEDNRLTDTGTGIVALYSPQLVLRRNLVAHALTDGGGGIALRESHDSLIENNTVLHCSVGMKLDAPVPGGGQLLVRGNLIAHNIIGLFFVGEAGGHQLSNNRFEHNLTTVAISAPGAGSANQWTDNRWDDYQGFDRDHNHIGDTPHEVLLYADRIWMETPKASFFRHSPALELLDFLERLAPFSTPHRVLQDPRPQM
jgi:nitrous oxidase accessory protein